MAKDKHPTEKVGRNPKIETHKADAKPADVAADTSKSEDTPKKAAKKLDSSLIKKITGLPAASWAWFNGLSRNTKLAIILVVILLFVGLLTFIFTRSTSDQTFSDEQVVETETEVETINASISLRQGTLEIKDENGEWVDVPTDYAPSEGDVLRTVGATSRSVIAYEDGTELRLDANSEIEFLTLRTDRIVVRHINGYTYSRVISNENRAYIIESTNAQYEAVGTAFKTAASGDEQAVEVYHNTVHETILNKKPNEGEKLTVKSLTTPDKDGEIEKLDIEQVKQDQFMTWNKNLDEQNENFKNDLGFLKDFDAPDINITSHQDGETVLLDSSATEGTIEFSGNTEKGSKVTVQSKSQSGSQPIDVSVDGGGNFTTPVLSAPLGNSVFEFVVKDRVGNTATKNIRINFQRKSAPVTSVQDGIALSAVKDGTKINLSWELLGNLKAEDGYKVVWADSSQPVYPGDTAQPTDKRSKTISPGKGTWFIRVCEYNSSDSKCNVYSNEVIVTID